MTGILLIITPAYNEKSNLAALYARLQGVPGLQPMPWRWLLVDDHSTDGTFAVLEEMAGRDARIGGLRLVSRVGSHAAMLAGVRCAAARLEIAAVVLLAADLQDPPEAVPAMLARWRDGADLVLASRAARPGLTFARWLAARTAHAIIRLLMPRSNYPWSGSDMAVLGRKAMLALGADHRPLGNIFVRLARLPLITCVVPVVKAPRAAGRSGWTGVALARIFTVSVSEAAGFGIGKRPPELEAEVGWVARSGPLSVGKVTFRQRG